MLTMGDNNDNHCTNQNETYLCYETAGWLDQRTGICKPKGKFLRFYRILEIETDY